jgi:hypothetical protein
MNVFLGHLPIAPLLYGIILAASIMLYRWRWQRGDYLHVLGSGTLLFVLFSMHGEAADTRMGAALAVLIIDIILAAKTLLRRHA